ncbi:ribosome maturation factor RimP [Campylobacter sp. MIT 21-1685]|uniref:ribosome maturation factor RimP n=1 Tax=unclassified Campylobacter TaxID=2593542 RepID=UPI00224AA251|nr:MULTISPECIES: ribosome maturation factor RimP [unclassified Campylobacter]MCX2682712.1 ribosome maturation factor RimP [Campylobacter sp. MIT 21-1684]MCX2750994.1 ribosome maturation factor RimP [Campylobacter sp. MIT 21-1682]MCX2807075.1 ribosome maturation factor RimP [Campylobacter sp. MIT 21-1685]
MNLQALCKEAEVEFYDAELIHENGKQIYRVSIVKKNGVNLDDCVRVSEILSPLFDVEAPVQGEYFLEVSSPGLERKLTKLQHFVLSVGEKVQITTCEKEKFVAEIVSVSNTDSNKVQILLKNDEKGEFSLDFNDIKKAKTFVQW